jgi:hypothetical protein
VTRVTRRTARTRAALSDDAAIHTCIQEVVVVSGPVIVNNPDGGSSNSLVIGIIVVIVVLLLIWFFLFGPGAAGPGPAATPGINITLPTLPPAPGAS